MSSKFDDIIKNKLSSYKASYDPADWSAMEELLDSPGKSIGAGWIWNLSAIGLILIGALAVAGFLYSDNFALQNNTLPEETNPGAELLAESFVANANPYLSGCDFLFHSCETAISNEKSTSFIADNSERSQNSDADIADVSIASSAVPSQLQNQKASNNNPLRTNKLLFSGHDDDDSYYALAEESELEFAMRRKMNGLRFNLIKPLSTNEIPVSEDEAMRFDKTELSNRIHNNWTYNFSVNSGISLSYLDDNLMPRLGFNIGLGMEAMFKDKLGLYAGLGYSMIEYETSIVDCNPSTRYRCPVYYTSMIKSIDIPISLRYNVLRKNNWRLFLKGGIINQIKLEEKFNYVFEPDNSEPPPPRSNNFTHNSATSSLERSFDRDFTLSEEQRYHLSYMTGFGLEKFIARQMSLGLEQDVLMTADKAGNKDARIVTFRVNGSIKFYPGR